MNFIKIFLAFLIWFLVQRNNHIQVHCFIHYLHQVFLINLNLQANKHKENTLQEYFRIIM